MKLFYDNEENRFFAEVYRTSKQQSTGNALVEMNNKIIGSKVLGYALYDSEYLDLGYELDRDYFAANYQQIFAAFEAAGTFESYLTLIKSILGSDTIINFEVPASGHLIINIQAPTGLFVWAAYKSGVLTPLTSEGYAPNKLAFSNAITGLTIDETIRVIEMLNIEGIFLEVNIVSDNTKEVK